MLILWLVISLFSYASNLTRYALERKSESTVQIRIETVQHIIKRLYLFWVNQYGGLWEREAGPGNQPR